MGLEEDEDEDSEEEKQVAGQLAALLAECSSVRHEEAREEVSKGKKAKVPQNKDQREARKPTKDKTMRLLATDGTYMRGEVTKWLRKDCIGLSTGSLPAKLRRLLAGKHPMHRGSRRTWRLEPKGIYEQRAKRIIRAILQAAMRPWQCAEVQSGAKAFHFADPSEKM
eukprot:4645043-Amphidinium_carterae.1